MNDTWYCIVQLGTPLYYTVAHSVKVAARLWRQKNPGRDYEELRKQGTLKTGRLTLEVIEDA